MKFALEFICELKTAHVLKQVCTGDAFLSQYTSKVWQLEVGMCLGSRAHSLVMHQALREEKIIWHISELPYTTVKNILKI